ncbi:MAG: WD40/YVTN/BNR-like repeat-containing protein [Acidimicrobiales bacterium]
MTDNGAAPGQGFFAGLRWRLVGPFRGGRVVAVAGHPGARGTFWFGSTGGGVWKTVDGGHSWRNVSDGFFERASVGALAIAPSDANVVYAGMGESCIRSNVAAGDGVYRSTDAGATWAHLGLEQTRHISRVRVHPSDPDLVYVAALGHAHGRNDERGVYRSADGGRTWELVLHRGPDAGAADLAIDPHNPRVLYACLWQARRLPWRLDSGGPGSGLWRSTDGGSTWSDLSCRPGLPKGTLGRIGVAPSPARPGRLWAIVEADDGAVFRSDDHGDHWERLSEQADLRFRAWYYQHVFADPLDSETVWALDMDVWRSHDGGRTFDEVPVPHGDAHDLWFDPVDPSRLILGSDGGANVSLDGGVTWSSCFNQPTAELYHVTTDTREPYRIYAAQQDNSTICLPSHSELGVITALDTYSVGGGESGHIAVRPDDPDIVFAGNYQGIITRYDHRRRTSRPIDVWPESSGGGPAGEARYRFNWTAPIVLSPHDPGVLYQAGNRVFRSDDEGQTWRAVSPDLTRNDPEKLRSSGGDLTADNTGAEYCCCVFALAESSLEQGLLWAGTDDGLVHVSRDAGSTWLDVTPPDMPEWARVSSVEPSRHEAGTAYVAAEAHLLDDPAPYLWRTSDLGGTWERLNAGLPGGEPCRVVREDPTRAGLLYLGTEGGAHVSHDGGRSWWSLRGNLPACPVHDLVVEGDDLVAATHGRSVWILDDLPAVREHDPARSGEAVRLYGPRTLVRYPAGRTLSREGPPGSRQHSWAGVAVVSYDLERAEEEGETEPVPVEAGRNRAAGVTVLYWLEDPGEASLTLTFSDGQGNEIRRLRSRTEDDEPDRARHVVEKGKDRPKEPRAPRRAGLNRFVWDTRHDPGTRIEHDPPKEKGLPEQEGPAVPPGTYEVRLEIGDHQVSASFEIAEDPRNPATPSDHVARYGLGLELWRRTSELNAAVNSIRELKHQLSRWSSRGGGDGRPDAAGRNGPGPSEVEAAAGPSEVESAAGALRDALTGVERDLTPVDAKGSLALGNPDRLDGRLRALSRFVDVPARPTESAVAVAGELSAQLDHALERLASLVGTDVAAFNDLLERCGVRAVGAPESKEEER